MRIISKFKDYYDYLAYVYGIDNSCTLTRELFSDKTECLSYSLHRVSPDKLQIYSIGGVEMRWLFVCGKAFPLTKISNSWKVCENLNCLVDSQFYIPKWIKSIYPGKFSDNWLNFNIEVKSPIILVDGGLCNGRKSLPYTTKSPILGDIVNFAKLYPETQIYQDIVYFLTNQINGGNADINPPVELDDKIKIEYHGFDKKSFRPMMKS